MPSLHDKTIIIDGLIVSNFGPEIFRAMRAGGITAANCTCSIWEDFPTSMRAIAQWKTWFREHANLILQVYGIADIHRAKAEGKTGVILGWQNAVGFDDHLPFIEVAYELGLRIVQMTYNTATSVGSGCYESNDGGLTDFGRDVVDEFNRLGILVDLSHVGSKTRGGRHCLFEEAGRLYALPSSGAQMEAIEYVGLGGAPYRCNRPSLCRSIRARPRQRLGYRG